MKTIRDCVKERGDYWRSVAPKHVRVQKEYNAPLRDKIYMSMAMKYPTYLATRIRNEIWEHK